MLACYRISDAQAGSLEGWNAWEGLLGSYRKADDDELAGPAGVIRDWPDIR